MQSDTQPLVEYHEGIHVFEENPNFFQNKKKKLMASSQQIFGGNRDYAEPKYVVYNLINMTAVVSFITIILILTYVFLTFNSTTKVMIPVPKKKDAFSHLPKKCIRQPKELANGLSCISTVLRNYMPHATWYLQLGSLIAVIRDEGNIMPWDHDVDITIYTPPNSQMGWKVAKVFNMSNMKTYETRHSSFCGQETKLEPEIFMPANSLNLNPPLNVSKKRGISRCATYFNATYCWKRTALMENSNTLPYVNRWYVNEFSIGTWGGMERIQKDGTLLVSFVYTWNFKPNELWPLKICQLCAHGQCADMYCPQNMNVTAKMMDELYPNSSWKPDHNVCNAKTGKWDFSEENWKKYQNGEMLKYTAL